MTFSAESYVYLDYAATAPLCEEAAAAMAPFQAPGRANLAANANANSLHSPGRAAFAALEQARKSVASDIGARRPDEVVFTGCATEADDAALIGLAHAAVQGATPAGKDAAPCVITTEIEHEAVVQPGKRLSQEGFEVKTVRPDRHGVVAPERLRAALAACERPVLVSVQAANSELGTVQPIAELAAVAHEAGALFHSDAVQALGKTPFDVQALGLDAATFAAHKVGGPKGVGALYLKARTPFRPYLLGGGQEAGRRSGTQNVAGAVGFAAALHAAVASQPQESARLRGLRDWLYARAGELPGVRPTVDVPAGDEGFLPNIVHLTVEGAESEMLVLQLDERGFGVSGGSACSSRSVGVSHVLAACGVSPAEAAGALRVSMGRYTTREDVEAFAQALEDVVEGTRR